MEPTRDRNRSTYRRLLTLLPADVRERFGSDMEEVFRARLAAAGTSRPRRVAVWLRAIVDVVVQAVTMRRTGRERDGWSASALAVDLRHGARWALATPAFSLVAVGTLALGIGASTATFSALDAVLFRELPVERPEELVFVWPEANANKAMTLLAGERMRSLESVAGMSAWTLTLTGVGEPVEIVGLQVSPGYFELLGVEPALGGAFDDGADLPGAEGVVLLSHGFWTRVFGADPEVVGRVIDLAGADHDRRRVTGVMPPGVERLWSDVDVWVPLTGDPALSLEADNTWYVNDRIGRLAPGATLAQAEAEVRAYAREVQQALPRQFSQEEAARATVRPVRAHLVEDVRAALWSALGAVGLVLLIGCFNVANLLLARGEARARDLAVRAALGAGRARTTRTLLAEAGLLCILGGAAGVAAAYGLVRLIAAAAPDGIPGLDAVALSPTVLAFALGVTALSILGAGLVPALRLGRADATAALGGAARGSAGRAVGRLSRTLVGAEVALATVVVVGSGLMLRSLTSLLAVDPGIDGSGVVTFKPNPPGGRYPDGEAFRAYYERVAEAVEALPGVESVGAINLLPGTANNWSFPTHPEGYEIPAGAPTPSVNFRAVRDDYFRTTRIPLVAGRLLDDGDRADAEPVVLVNEAFAETFWPSGDPLDRSLVLFSASGTRYRVVGVVADVRQHGRATEPTPEMYFSHAQVPWNQMSMWIMARVDSADPLAHADPIRAAVWAIDPDVPLSGMAHLEDVLGESTRTARFLTLLLGAFGVAALLLSAVGVFAVASYASDRRRPEFGVRLALGSTRASVVRAGVAGTVGPIVAGLVVGLAAARVGSTLLGAVLYEVRPSDPGTFAAVALMLAGVGLGASLVPAWRASAVDPASVLGSE